LFFVWKRARPLAVRGMMSRWQKRRQWGAHVAPAAGDNFREHDYLSLMGSGFMMILKIARQDAA
jgi:hypothetical protein